MSSSTAPTRHTAITSWSSVLPEHVVTNQDLEKVLDTSDEWIVERTGIRERRMGSTTSELATKAAQKCLSRAKLTGESIDALIVCTITPDQMFPAVATEVANAIGFTGPTFDLNAACSGFVYGLSVANGLIATNFDRVLLIGAETMSKAVDQTDRRTAILFGDGASAVLLQVSPNDVGLLGFDAGTDGSARGLLFQNHGEKLQMDGKEVFRRAVRATVESANTAIQKAKVKTEDISLFIPHQANLRIIEAVVERLGVPMENTVVTVEKTGNTSAASVPLALAEAADAGRIKDGDLLLVSGFGAGMSWASAVWKWGQ